MSSGSRDSDGDASPREKPAPAIDRASESIVGRSLPPRPSAVSSGEIEIAPPSIGPDSLAGTSNAPSVAPQSRSFVDPMEQPKPGLPLGTLVGIAAGVIVALSLLALLLFR